MLSTTLATNFASSRRSFFLFSFSGDNNYFASVGGITAMGKSLAEMVLVYPSVICLFSDEYNYSSLSRPRWFWCCRIGNTLFG